MNIIQCFLNVYLNSPNSDWKKEISDELKARFEIWEIQITGIADEHQVQVSFIFDADRIFLDQIEELLANNAGTITQVNIHLTSEISGVNDPYGASGISFVVEENLKKITGVLASGISEMGIIKVRLDHSLKDKQTVINEIIKVVKSIRTI